VRLSALGGCEFGWFDGESLSVEIDIGYGE
jgi:hypothetical protein